MQCPFKGKEYFGWLPGIVKTIKTTTLDGLIRPCRALQSIFNLEVFSSPLHSPPLPFPPPLFPSLPFPSSPHLTSPLPILSFPFLEEKTLATAWHYTQYQFQLYWKSKNQRQTGKLVEDNERTSSPGWERFLKTQKALTMGKMLINWHFLSSASTRPLWYSHFQCASHTSHSVGSPGWILPSLFSWPPFSKLLY